MRAFRGSKNRKTIAVNGGEKIPVAAEKECVELAEVNKQLHTRPSA
jgi:hypothetical protein